MVHLQKLSARFCWNIFNCILEENIWWHNPTRPTINELLSLPRTHCFGFSILPSTFKWHSNSYLIGLNLDCDIMDNDTGVSSLIWIDEQVRLGVRVIYKIVSVLFFLIMRPKKKRRIMRRQTSWQAKGQNSNYADWFSSHSTQTSGIVITLCWIVVRSYLAVNQLRSACNLGSCGVLINRQEPEVVLLHGANSKKDWLPMHSIMFALLIMLTRL